MKAEEERHKKEKEKHKNVSDRIIIINFALRNTKNREK